MLRLNIKRLAEERGITLADLQREAKLGPSTAKRYWFGTKSGSSRDGELLESFRLPILEAIAEVLDVWPIDLISVED